MKNEKVMQLEAEIMEKITQLNQLRKSVEPIAIPNYTFQTLTGPVSLLQLFGEKDTLFAIHNMGQGCRYCTLWADGLNGFVEHMEDKFAFALLSKDDPKTQRRMANDRGWRYQMASHGGGNYITEQSVAPGEKNMPGIVCYLRQGEKIFRKTSAIFGPGDIYCSLWSILGLAGIDSETWTPQFSYWNRPAKLDDGGENLNA